MCGYNGNNWEYLDVYSRWKIDNAVKVYCGKFYVQFLGIKLQLNILYFKYTNLVGLIPHDFCDQ